VGDRLRDVLPAEKLGGRGILVSTGAKEALIPSDARQRFAQVSDLPAAVTLILASQSPHGTG
jgi:phosphoglycolate phosphatase-like HAD superfamily hydrolase